MAYLSKIFSGSSIHLIILLVALGFVLFPSEINAQEPAADEQIAWLPPDEPTEVFFALVILDIPKFNEREQNYTIEAALTMEWFDDRLASGFESGYHGNDATSRLGTEIWAPMLEFQNVRGVRQIINSQLIINPEGQVFYDERFVATLASPLDLRKFPFDQQKLDIEITSFSYISEEMIFAEDSEIILSPQFTLAEWDLDQHPSTVIEDRPLYGLDDRSLFSSGIFSITLNRITTYYIWNILIPLFIITATSWASFWLDPNLPARWAIAFSSMLTIVAYNFAISNTLPRISYLTFLDKIFIMTYIFVALSIAQSVVSYTVKKKNPASSEKIDQVSRWLFPLFYVLLYISLIMITL